MESPLVSKISASKVYCSPSSKPVRALPIPVIQWGEGIKQNKFSSPPPIEKLGSEASTRGKDSLVNLSPCGCILKSLIHLRKNDPKEKTSSFFPRIDFFLPLNVSLR